jgi:hypothetical protein
MGGYISESEAYDQLIDTLLSLRARLDDESELHDDLMSLIERLEQSHPAGPIVRPRPRSVPNLLARGV